MHNIDIKQNTALATISLISSRFSNSSKRIAVKMHKNAIIAIAIKIVVAIFKITL